MQKSVQFETAGKQKLAGVLHLPDAGSALAYALFAHCFTCTKNIKAATNIADSLCAQGLAVLRFDFTGLGQSQGDFATSSFSSNVEDLLAAAAYLQQEYAAPSILVGHSLGGTACLAAARQIESVRAVATLGSPADAEHVLGLIEDDIETIESQGEARVNLGGRMFTLREDFLRDVRAQSVRDGVRHLRCALLVMHSPLDNLVPIEEAGRIYSSALHPKSFVSLHDADHLLSRERDSRYAGSVLAAWASRYLEETLPPVPTAPFQPDHVVVLGRTDEQFRVSINANGHALHGDEPKDSGGHDTGPSPYDYLSAALASCTVMTINMYARHKKLPLDSAQVSVRHDRIHAQDCEECETRAGKIDHLDRAIHLTGDLTPQQRQRLLEIADRCPVHKTLHGEIKVVTSLIP